MIDKFIKQSSSSSVSLFDVCSGSIEHINLKHVVRLNFYSLVFLKYRKETTGAINSYNENEIVENLVPA